MPSKEKEKTTPEVIHEAPVKAPEPPKPAPKKEPEFLPLALRDRNLFAFIDILKGIGPIGDITTILQNFDVTYLPQLFDVGSEIIAIGQPVNRTGVTNQIDNIVNFLNVFAKATKTETDNKYVEIITNLSENPSLRGFVERLVCSWLNIEYQQTLTVKAIADIDWTTVMQFVTLLYQLFQAFFNK